MIEGDYKNEEEKKNYRNTTTIMCIYIKMDFDSRNKKTIHTKYESKRTNQKKKKSGSGLNLSVHNELATFARHSRKKKSNNNSNNWNK